MCLTLVRSIKSNWLQALQDQLHVKKEKWILLKTNHTTSLYIDIGPGFYYIRQKIQATHRRRPEYSRVTHKVNFIQLENIFNICTSLHLLFEYTVCYLSTIKYLNTVKPFDRHWQNHFLGLTNLFLTVMAVTVLELGIVWFLDILDSSGIERYSLGLLWWFKHNSDSSKKFEISSFLS